MTRYVKEAEEDQRIADLLKILREKDVGENFADAKSKDNIKADSLDSVKFNFIS